MALAFKQKYPNAFRKYKAHCLSPPPDSKLTIKQHQANLVGTILLIPPSNDIANQRQASKTPHYIACLFTSLDYGKRVSPPEEILDNTGNALKDFARQVAEIRQSSQELGDCHAVRINSGKFGVEWQKTKAVLEAGDVDITVFRPEEEGRGDGVGTTVRGKFGKPATKDERAMDEKPPVRTTARRHSPRSSVETLFDEQRHGVKRKDGRDLAGENNEDGAETKRKEPAQLHPGIAKRRKKLGLEA